LKNLQRYLYLVANARRRELLPYIYHSTHGTVQKGTFAGTVIVPRSMWGDGDLAAKLLGVYESELSSCIDDAVDREPDLVVNIGSAEGYYAIGLARCLPKARVLAVDVEPLAAEITAANIEANKVTNVETIIQEVDTAWLQRCLGKNTNALLVMDCEGAELTLLDPKKVRALKQTTMLVECHDCLHANLTEIIAARFDASHEVTTIWQNSQGAYDFEFMRPLSDCDKWCLVHEGRPSAGTWLYMVPKQ